MDKPDREALDYIQLTRLQAAYADIVNRRAWPEFDTLFLPDASVRVDTVTNPAIELTGPGAVGDFIGGAIERFEFFEFVPLNIHAEIGADTARARVFMCELRQAADNGAFSRAFGVYHDQYRRVDGRWWFATRRYQSLARTGRDEVFPFPADGFA